MGGRVVARLLTVRLARLIEALGEAALLDKASIELAQLLVEQIVRLANQADQRVRGGLRRASLDMGPIGLI